MAAMGQESEATVGLSSSNLLRRTNMRAVLEYAWDVETLTATAAMEATGLTRSTVLGRADDLVEIGWLRELDDAPTAGQRVKGRPARRYAFDPQAGYVMGIDAGQHRLSVRVADLRGQMLACAVRRPHRAGDEPSTRVALVREAVVEAMASVGAAQERVLVTVVGVPAPVDQQGQSPGGIDHYWRRMNCGFADVLQIGQTVEIDNDANLAAVAEASAGGGVGLSSFVALLSGERFGAGLIVNDTLLRGVHGAAGEMQVLDLVDGLGSADGLGALARQWAWEAIQGGAVPEGSPMLRRAPARPELADVVDAERRGEAEACAIVERLAERLARVSTLLAGLLNVERIIVCGGVASDACPVIASATQKLLPHSPLPVAQLVASSLGSDSVTVGAVHRALALVRANPLAYELPGA
jgi:predicted NBD/HSP70 family sugar kinase